MPTMVKIIENNKDEILGELDEAIDRALESVGLQASNYAMMGTPEDTGLLRNSMTYALGGQGAAISSYTDDKGIKTGQYSGSAPAEERTVFIGTNVEYAPYVEFGHHLPSGDVVAGQHFLERAIVGHKSKYKKLIETALKGF